MNENVYDLSSTTGDTNFTYTDLVTQGYVSTQVKVRISVNATTFATGYYMPQYIETPPTNTNFNTLSFG